MINNLKTKSKNHPLLKKQLFLFDMDGTIYKDDELFEGVIDFLNFLSSRGKQYLFVTNNSSKSHQDYLAKLSKLKIPHHDHSIVSSIDSLALYLRKYGQKPIYAVATQSMMDHLRKLGFNIVTEIIEGIVAIIVGNDNELTFKKLYEASYILTTQNVAFLATNVDLNCPTGFGYVPDCGSICHILTTASGKRPRYFGKPSKQLAQYIEKKTNVKIEDMVMIGDRLYTDMTFAIKNKMTSVCLLSGEATMQAIDKFPHSIDYVFQDISAMYEAMKG